MVKKIYFPREVLPISFVISQFVNMLFGFVVVFAVLVISGKGLSLKPLLFMPLVMLIEFILTMGMTLLFSALTVYLRDIANILSIGTMAWQFVTPVMYGRDQVPDRLMWLFDLNPMSSVIESYRDILYYQQIPRLDVLLIAALFGFAFLIIGAIVFRRLQRGFAENL
jgi:ABC-2 type transport system permease protein